MPEQKKTKPLKTKATITEGKDKIKAKNPKSSSTSKTKKRAVPVEEIVELSDRKEGVVLETSVSEPEQVVAEAVETPEEEPCPKPQWQDFNEVFYSKRKDTRDSIESPIPSEDDWVCLKHFRLYASTAVNKLKNTALQCKLITEFLTSTVEFLALCDKVWATGTEKIAYLNWQKLTALKNKADPATFNISLSDATDQAFISDIWLDDSTEFQYTQELDEQLEDTDYSKDEITEDSENNQQEEISLDLIGAQFFGTEESEITIPGSFKLVAYAIQLARTLLDQALAPKNTEETPDTFTNPEKLLCESREAQTDLLSSYDLYPLKDKKFSQDPQLENVYVTRQDIYDFFNTSDQDIVKEYHRTIYQTLSLPLLGFVEICVNSTHILGTKIIIKTKEVNKASLTWLHNHCISWEQASSEVSEQDKEKYWTECLVNPGQFITVGFVEIPEEIEEPEPLEQPEHLEQADDFEEEASFKSEELLDDEQDDTDLPSEPKPSLKEKLLEQLKIPFHEQPTVVALKKGLIFADKSLYQLSKDMANRADFALCLLNHKLYISIFKKEPDETKPALVLSILKSHLSTYLHKHFNPEDNKLVSLTLSYSQAAYSFSKKHVLCLADKLNSIYDAVVFTATEIFVVKPKAFYKACFKCNFNTVDACIDEGYPYARPSKFWYPDWLDFMQKTKNYDLHKSHLSNQIRLHKEIVYDRFFTTKNIYSPKYLALPEVIIKYFSYQTDTKLYEFSEINHEYDRFHVADYVNLEHANIYNPYTPDEYSEYIPSVKDWWNTTLCTLGIRKHTQPEEIFACDDHVYSFVEEPSHLIHYQQRNTTLLHTYLSDVLDPVFNFPPIKEQLLVASMFRKATNTGKKLLQLAQDTVFQSPPLFADNDFLVYEFMPEPDHLIHYPQRSSTALYTYLSDVLEPVFNFPAIKEQLKAGRLHRRLLMKTKKWLGLVKDTLTIKLLFEDNETLVYEFTPEPDFLLTYQQRLRTLAIDDLTFSGDIDIKVKTPWEQQVAKLPHRKLLAKIRRWIKAKTPLKTCNFNIETESIHQFDDLWVHYVKSPIPKKSFKSYFRRKRSVSLIDYHEAVSSLALNYVGRSFVFKATITNFIQQWRTSVKSSTRKITLYFDAVGTLVTPHKSLRKFQRKNTGLFKHFKLKEKKAILKLVLLHKELLLKPFSTLYNNDANEIIGSFKEAKLSLFSLPPVFNKDQQFQTTAQSLFFKNYDEKYFWLDWANKDTEFEYCLKEKNNNYLSFSDLKVPAIQLIANEINDIHTLLNAQDCLILPLTPGTPAFLYQEEAARIEKLFKKFDIPNIKKRNNCKDIYPMSTNKIALCDSHESIHNMSNLVKLLLSNFNFHKKLQQNPTSIQDYYELHPFEPVYERQYYRQKSVNKLKAAIKNSTFHNAEKFGTKGINDNFEKNALWSPETCPRIKNLIIKKLEETSETAVS